MTRPGAADAGESKVEVTASVESKDRKHALVAGAGWTSIGGQGIPCCSTIGRSQQINYIWTPLRDVARVDVPIVLIDYQVAFELNQVCRPKRCHRARSAKGLAAVSRFDEEKAELR